MQILPSFSKLPKLVRTVFAFFLIIVIAILNILSGWEIDFSIFYIIPVAFSIWFIGIRTGVITCVICALTWFGVDLFLEHPYTSEFVHYWNTLIRIIFFALFGLLLNLLRITHERERLAARTDSLTGVANSRCFYELLDLERERSMRYKTPFTLAYIDLDNFKSVNDRYGHTVGDKALKEITDYVKKKISGRQMFSDG